ncbi:MAG TPA: (4Fe-4S)-binding protein [Holophagaceae bacterium]|nr:(4Fe-4S)-binding protein [Holophagaceae bacterium]
MTILRYTNGEVTIVWKPELCMYSKRCWTELGEVFDPSIRPWIRPEGAPTDRIIEQVGRCPSGALSYYRNEEGEAEPEVSVDQVVEVTANGPLLIYGNLTVKDAEGRVTRRTKVTAFCRCGASCNKPYCDGSHAKAGFKG